MPSKLSEDFIKDCLKKAYQPGVIASTDGYAELYKNTQLKCAAVLVPLVWWKDEWELLFTRRTELVEHHKGQVSFPGGGCDLGDTAAEETAVREAEEEIGLRPDDVRVLGRLNDIVTITSYQVTPVVGVMPWPYKVLLEPVEVERVFTIPLLWLADRMNWDEQFITPDGKKRSFPVLKYQPYESEILWGASARITQNFLSVLGLLNT